MASEALRSDTAADDAAVRPLHELLGVELPYVVDALVDDASGVRLALRAQGASFVRWVGFDDVYALRRTDEADLVDYARRHEILRPGVFEVARSEFLDWAASENLHQTLPEGVRHFAFASSNDLVEVLAFDEPRPVGSGADRVAVLEV